MPHINESIWIERPAQEVFDFVADPANQMLINSSIIEFEQDGPSRKGATARGVTRVAGRNISWTSEMVEYDEGRRAVVRSVESPVGFEITYTYTPDGNDATTFRFEQETPEMGGFFGKIGDAVATKMYSRDVRAWMENLKILLEEG